MFRFFKRDGDAASSGEPRRTLGDWLNADVGDLLRGKAPAPRDAPSAPVADPPAPPEPAAAAVDAAPQVTAAVLVETAPPPTVPPAPPASHPPPVEDDRDDWLARLRGGLKRTGSSLAQAFVGAELTDELYEDLEAALLQADAGAEATIWLLDELRRRVTRAEFRDPQAVRRLLARILAELLAPLEKELVVGEAVPTVIMVCGVNGAGKTTTIGKLTRHLMDADRKVLLAAADTFRAAAREQLMAWAERAGKVDLAKVEIVSQQGGDPAGVTFDAVVAGKARGADVVIADTAGRLTTQSHLMEELKKIRRTIGKAEPGAPHEVLLVIDGNSGQNALSQVKAFDAALGLTGLVVTKLDGTAKGGVLAAIALWSRQREKALPVYFIGVGETLADLQTFRAREFSEALVLGT
jgi:fused signal recognition particle receptor